VLWLGRATRAIWRKIAMCGIVIWAFKKLGSQSFKLGQSK